MDRAVYIVGVCWNINVAHPMWFKKCGPIVKISRMFYKIVYNGLYSLRKC